MARSQCHTKLPTLWLFSPSISPQEQKMARSLTVKHDEKPATSPLLNSFLLLAFGWLLLSGFAAANATTDTDTSTEINLENIEIYQ